ncbi:MAG: redox-regulated ATPase YchF [Methanoculleaceae archaeon]
MITLALAGKPNSGKSTFYTAATMAPAEIADYPFTTIDANHGVAAVRVECPCRELGVECQECTDGVRFVPVGLIDVAGLVPEAHLGKGLGNQFLDHLRQADAIIHVVDASGGTDSEGNPVGAGNYDPRKDIEFLPREISMWVAGIIGRHWDKIRRKAQQRDLSIEEGIAGILAGHGVTREMVRDAEDAAGISLESSSADDLPLFAHHLVAISKPMAIAANKVDEAPDRCLEILTGEHVVFTSAVSELALRRAARSGFVRYLPGDRSFSIVEGASLTRKQRAGLEKIAAVIERFSGTGVQQAIQHTVFSLLDMIVVFPVEDEHRMTDGNGRVLPDAFLLPRGSGPRDLAYRIHTDIGEGYLYAIDARTGMRISDTAELRSGDVIKIVSTAH